MCQFRSACLIGLGWFALFAKAQPILDQSFTPPTSYGGYDASINSCCAYIAQTYTAGLTGTLAGVSISVESQSVHPLHIAIRTVSEGVPTNTVLGDIELASSSTTLSDLIAFPQSIPQTAGTQYAIVVNYVGAPPPAEGAEQGTWHGAISTTFQDLYPAGTNFGSFDGMFTPHPDVAGDLFFKTFVNPVINVTIDIKPGEGPSPINTKSRGKIPVAILSSPAFDAPLSIDRSTITFGRTGSEHSLAFCNPAPSDISGDGLPDLLCHFETQLTDFQPGDTMGILQATTLSGQLVLGADRIRVVH